MVMLGIAVTFALVLCWLAFWANARFKNEDRLPMQWWLTGAVTWSAPRALALAFIPALAVCLLSIHLILAISVRPRTGQETMVLPILIGIGSLFVVAQLLHFWLIEKTFRRNGG